MSTATLQNVLDINHEIAALADAGVPIRLGSHVTSTNNTLERINESLELRTRLGQNVLDAITDNPDLPSEYRHALLVGMAADAPELTLAGVARQPEAQNELRTATSRAMIQPLIVFALAYCGFILICAMFVPTLNGIYEQIRQQPSTQVQLLDACRAAMPYWIPLVPILMLIAIIWWHRHQGQPPRWIPGVSRYLKSVKNALFTEELARLVQTGMPPFKAARLAAGTTGDAVLIKACATLTEGLQNHNSAESTRQVSLPPLVHWALSGNLEREDLVGVLQFAAQTYRQSAERMAVLWQTALPILLGGLLGGAIVLLYGLSVFWPYVQMMRDLAT